MKTAYLFLLVSLALPAQAVRSHGKASDSTPVTARPQGTTALSTAQTGGSRDGERLRELPSMASVQSDGTTVQVGSLSHPDYWLLLYRGDACAPCNQVMDALVAHGSAAVRSGTGLVVLLARSTHATNSGTDHLDALKSKYKGMTDAVWLDDSQGTAIAALKPHGQPVLYAVHNGTIGWSAPGNLGNGKMLADLASSWLLRNAKTAPSTAVLSKADK